MKSVCAFLSSVCIIVGCPQPDGEGGEGEGGEGEGDDVGGGSFGEACREDGDCTGPLAACLEAHCFESIESRCHDSRFAYQTIRDDLSSSAMVDCGLWGGECVQFVGCALPTGSTCPTSASCNGPRGTQPCVAGTCDADADDDHASLDAPSPVTVPALVEMRLDPHDVDCVSFETVDTAVFHIRSDQPFVFVFNNGRASSTGNDGHFQFNPGTIIVCISSQDAAPYDALLDIQAAVPEALPTFCVGDDIVNAGQQTACPEEQACSARVGHPKCRSVAGAACAPGTDGCIGTCHTDEVGVSTCRGEEFDPFLVEGTCAGLTYFRGGLTNGAFSVEGTEACPSRCEVGFGCVGAPGEPCVVDLHWCIDDNDNLSRCETGTCP
jgi:hypothetical protein